MRLDDMFKYGSTEDLRQAGFINVNMLSTDTPSYPPQNGDIYFKLHKHGNPTPIPMHISDKYPFGPFTADITEGATTNLTGLVEDFDNY